MTYTGSSAWIQWTDDNSTTCGSTSVWKVWSGNTLISSGTVKYGYDCTVTWNRWTAGTGDTGTVGTWHTWTRSAGSVVYQDIPPIPQTPETPETPEQLADREFQQSWGQAIYEDQERTRKRADRKAVEILLAHLTAAQQRTFQSQKYFDVKGGKSGQLYRIRDGRQHNIYLVDEKGEHEVEFCITADLPTGDILLAQKLWLECLEEKFWEVANAWDRKRTDQYHCLPKGQVLHLDEIRRRRAERRAAA